MSVVAATLEIGGPEAAFCRVPAGGRATMSCMKPRRARQYRQFAVLRKTLIVLLALVVVFVAGLLVVTFLWYSRSLAVTGALMLLPFLLTWTAVVVTLKHVDHLSRTENWALLDKVIPPVVKTGFITLGGIALAFVNQAVGRNPAIDGPDPFQILVAIAAITLIAAMGNAFDAVYAAYAIARERRKDRIMRSARHVPGKPRRRVVAGRARQDVRQRARRRMAARRPAR